jgi:hypothetical protein
MNSHPNKPYRDERIEKFVKLKLIEVIYSLNLTLEKYDRNCGLVDEVLQAIEELVSETL